MSALNVYSPEELKIVCPFKWHNKIPPNGISLGIADIDFEGPRGTNEYLRKHLQEGFAFYQEQTGLLGARKAAQSYLSSFNSQIAIDNIQITPGTMLGIYSAMKWITKKKGHILSVGPIYEPIHFHATDNGNQLRWHEMNSEGLDIDKFNTIVSRETKMISICNPLNPYGHVFSTPELKAISQLCVDNDIICFSDELYAPLVFNGSHNSILQFDDMIDRTIALYGFSKAYGLAGYRSGFLYAGNLILDEIQDIINHILVSPSPIASLICEFALTSEIVSKWVDVFRSTMHKNTKLAAEKFKQHGLRCEIPLGGFFVFPNIGKDDVEFTKDCLELQGVQVIEGSKFGPMGKNHIRINCGTSQERLLDAIDRILKIV